METMILSNDAAKQCAESVGWDAHRFSRSVAASTIERIARELESGRAAPLADAAERKRFAAFIRALARDME